MVRNDSWALEFDVTDVGRDWTIDAAQAAGYSNVGGASVVREELIEKELIWSPRRGQIDFTVPRFAQYLQATHNQRT